MSANDNDVEVEGEPEGEPEAEPEPAIRLERTLKHSPERVWEALTEESELETWCPEHLETMKQGEITTYDAPRVLEYTWGEDVLRWELLPTEEGCVVVFTTRIGANDVPTLARAA